MFINEIHKDVNHNNIICSYYFYLIFKSQHTFSLKKMILQSVYIFYSF